MRIRPITRWALVSLAALLLLGCAARPRDPLDGTAWTLVAYRKSRPIPGTTITATFSEGEVSGSAGCNRYSGPYRVEGQAIAVGPLAITEMACPSPEGVMAQEQEVMALLGKARTYAIDEQGRLVLTEARESLTYAPAPAP